jgi:hypothetical protein
MKRLLYISVFVIILGILLSGVTCSGINTKSTLNTGTQSTPINSPSREIVLHPDPAQEVILNNIYDNLTQKDIPIKSIQLISGSEDSSVIIVKVTVESGEGHDTFTLDVVLYTTEILRAVNFSQLQGLSFDWIRLTFIDKKGEIIAANEQKPLDKDLIMSQYNAPLVLDDDTVSKLIISNTNFYDLSLKKLEVTGYSNGFREISILLQAADIDIANQETQGLLNTVSKTIDYLNKEQNAQIGAFFINLSTSAGQTLLVYSYDLSLKQSSIWHSKLLTTSLYPPPPPGLQ